MSAPAIAWAKLGGLVPAVVQDAATGAVLMLGYMSPESLAATEASGDVTFFSRSRGRLWRKGETSGHTLRLVRIAVDCDGDALLVLATPRGPTCHTGVETCFGPEGWGLHALGATIARRAAGGDMGSYTRRLLDASVVRRAQKVGEEGVEVALAAVTGDDRELLGEAADLIYHLLVLLHGRGLGLADVVRVLAARAEAAAP